VVGWYSAALWDINFPMERMCSFKRKVAWCTCLVCLNQLFTSAWRDSFALVPDGSNGSLPLAMLCRARILFQIHSTRCGAPAHQSTLYRGLFEPGAVEACWGDIQTHTPAEATPARGLHNVTSMDEAVCWTLRPATDCKAVGADRHSPVPAQTSTRCTMPVSHDRTRKPPVTLRWTSSLKRDVRAAKPSRKFTRSRKGLSGFRPSCQ
jgi:hypothetical protein